MTIYRSLAEKEIATMTVYGCSSENWKDVQVATDFSPVFIQNVHFSGKVFLGTYQKVFELAGEVKKHAGIYNCELHNCSVGNDVYINKIANYIANCNIEEGAFIENVNLILNEGVSSFGNGTKVAVMIESGGREIPIIDTLSAPLAYLLAFYRYKNKAIESLLEQIQQYILSQQSNASKIGKNVRIVNCGTLKNVKIGDSAQIDGALLLENGTITSNEKASVTIGAGVQCQDFIIGSGTSITESALISNCFIGQACIFGKQFSAIDSLFFANCQGLHGEAVSVFAGPYTVTHHKSTLMLTALYSFMNAGSGTNFSNHMYKLGPVHQGITERGVKTSSDSYIMWPAKIGAFTVVLGRHKGNPDISDLPFSYLIEDHGESYLLPGINLHSAGTMRDVQKWAKRDNRTDSNLIDSINFEFLSPYTLSKVLKGIAILKELLEKIEPASQFIWYQNCKIKRSAIKKGIDLYEMALFQFVGNKLSGRIKNLQEGELLDLLKSASNTGTGNWVDMAGLLAPKSEIDKLISLMETDGLSLIEIQTALHSIHANYDQLSWNWAVDVSGELLGKKASEITDEDVLFIIDKGEKATSGFTDLILRDAKKEFNSISKTGFGLDGDENDKLLDFEATRGTFESHPFVAGLLKNN